MKVYVTQGHEKGIGLEVFFKTCLMLSDKDLRNIRLLAFKEAVESTLKTMSLPFSINGSSLSLCGRIIDADWGGEIEHSQSFTCLLNGMKLAEQSGVLYTLPTSKDQFPGYPGHTEFFRKHYDKDELGMFFSSARLQVLLLTDHVSIKELPELMTEKLIYGRLKASLETLKRWDWPVKRVLVSGLNPHAGESGMIGKEDERVTKAIQCLRSEVKIDFMGPYPGDTMLLEQKSHADLLVYLFHDQGLPVFKGLQGFIGSNITLGLPYPRFSPDHGTSFALYGKNHADFRGCQFSLKEALNMLKKVSYGKNSGHKSQGS